MQLPDRNILAHRLVSSNPQLLHVVFLTGIDVFGLRARTEQCMYDGMWAQQADDAFVAGHNTGLLYSGTSGY